LALLDWVRRKTRARVIDLQHQTCQRFAASCLPVVPGSKAGVALQTRGQLPLNALRHAPVAGASGWYLWWGDTLTEHPEFFQPLHVEHLADYAPELVPYMSLPAGWRVQLAPGHEDVWFDTTLIQNERANGS
jgi:hypothetical protein